MNDENDLNPFIRCVVLPLFQRLYRSGGPVSSRLLAELFGRARRTAYNWLHALQEAGLAKLKGKRWVAV